MADANMVLDAVDDHDRVIGSVLRRDVFSTRTNFRVAHVFLFNAAGDLLVQKIAKGLRHAGQWGSSVAGYVAKGESYTNAAIRRLDEELGLRGVHLTTYGVSEMVDRGCRKFIALLRGTAAQSIRMDAAYSDGLEFLPLQEIAALRLSGQRPFTATFLHLLDYYASQTRP